MGLVHRPEDRLTPQQRTASPEEQPRNILMGKRDPAVVWDEAPGAEAWLDNMVDEDLPNVLDVDYLKSGNTILPTTSDQRQRVFCGYSLPQRPRDRPALDIYKHQPAEQSYLAAFDVDSYVAFATSLAVARHGLKVIMVQRPTPPIKASLHLGRFKVWIHDEFGDLV